MAEQLLRDANIEPMTTVIADVYWTDLQQRIAHPLPQIPPKQNSTRTQVMATIRATAQNK